MAKKTIKVTKPQLEEYVHAATLYEWLKEKQRKVSPQARDWGYYEELMELLALSIHTVNADYHNEEMGWISKLETFLR